MTVRKPDWADDWANKHLPGFSFNERGFFAQALREAYERGATEMRERAAIAAVGAKLPEHFQWGVDALEQFDFGKFRAQLAIEALNPSNTEPKK